MASALGDAVLMRFVGAVLLVIAVIHLAPVTGALGSRQLLSLYGVDASGDASVQLLLRHRAVLFGLLGASLAVMAFQPSLHAPALLLAGISVTSFLYLAAGNASLLGPAIHRVVRIDAVALVLLMLAGIAQALRWFGR